MTARWLDIETEAGLLHLRPGLPDRWDIAVTRHWPAENPVSRRRYARQIRQDIWRALAGLRGLVPRVMVAQRRDHLTITGGAVLVTGRAHPGVADRIAALLDNPDNRRRWDAYARSRKGDACSRKS